MFALQPFIQIPQEIEEPIWEVAKFLVLLGLLFYLAFAVLVIRQVQLMTRTLAGELDRAIRVFAWVHFALVLAVVVLALVVL